MANIDKSIRVRKLKTGSDTLVLPSQQKGNEGNVGKFYDNYLKEKGFEINSGRGIDLPGLHIENKTRKRSSKAPHTVGTITYDVENTNPIRYHAKLKGCSIRCPGGTRIEAWPDC